MGSPPAVLQVPLRRSAPTARQVPFERGAKAGRRWRVERTPGVTRFERLALIVHRRRRWVVAAWIGIVVVALPFAPRAPGALRAGGFSLDDLEAARARATLVRELGVAPSAMVLVIEATGPARAGDRAFEAAAAAATIGVASAPHVRQVVSHRLAPSQVAADRTTAYDIVLLDLAPDDSPAALPGVEAALRPVDEVRVTPAGGPAFYGDIQAVSEADLRRSELLSLPLAAVALLLVFGSVVSAGVPLAVGGAAVLIALAGVFALASFVPMSIFVLNLVTLLGLGLGVDYSLLMLSRFREELAGRVPAGQRADDAAIEAAIRVTVATAGRAVFFSGVTVLLGLLGLVLFEFMILRSVGIAGALVVGVAVAAALTLLPAVLSLLGSRVDALAVRRLRAPTDDGAGAPTGAWARLARRVMQRPLAVFVPTLAFLLLLGVPFLHVRFNAPDATILPETVSSRAAFETLVREFGEGAFAPLTLAVRTTGPATAPDTIAALFAWSRRLAADPRVTRVDSFVDIDPRLGAAQYQLLYAAPGGPPDRFARTLLTATTSGDLAAFTITTAYGPNRDEARALVRDLRDPHGPLAPPAGVSVLVGGGAADVADTVDRVAADFPRTGLFIVITTYLVLFVLLRSAWLPLKAVLMNMLSIAAAFGALVWVFQDGNFSALLGFRPLGFVETTLPVILFCVLFGLSMDYEVFLLTRMKEVWDRTGDNTEAVATGLERSGRIVTSAALIVIVVAGSFVFADIVLIKALGLGVALAVALDATVVRALLVPATMRLLGKWNWWLPARLERVLRIACRAPRPRWRPASDEPGARIDRPRRAPRARGGRLLRADPGQRARPAPGDRDPHAGAAGASRPAADRAAARRRPACQADRVVVLHGSPRRGRRAHVRVRGRDLPGRARGLPGLVGEPSRDHRRSGRPLCLQPARRDRPPGGSVAPRRVRRPGRVRALALGRRPGSAGAGPRPLDDGRRRRGGHPRRGALAGRGGRRGRPGRDGPRPAPRARQAGGPAR